MGLLAAAAAPDGAAAPAAAAAALLAVLRAACAANRRAARHSVVSVGDCRPLGSKVAVKTYAGASTAAKKQKMATREAIVLKYLNSQG